MSELLLSRDARHTSREIATADSGVPFPQGVGQTAPRLFGKTAGQRKPTRAESSSSCSVWLLFSLQAPQEQAGFAARAQNHENIAAMLFALHLTLVLCVVTQDL